MLKKRIFYLSFVVILVMSQLAACKSTSGGGKGGGGTLIVGRGGDSVFITGANASDGESWRVSQEIHEPLVKLEGTSTKIIPALAETWESPDATTWTFHLRKGVKFHDGTEFNADAVVFNFDLWSKADNEWRFGRTFEYYDTVFGSTNLISSYKAVDKNTFQLVLSSPSASVLYNLAINSFAIASPTAIKKYGKDYGTAAGSAVGTGPFMFKEWIPNDHITLVKNPKWWGVGPKLDSIIFRSIPDNSARFAELQAGTVDQADLAQTDMAAAKADPNIVDYVTPSAGVGYIAFQQCTPPFDNVKVRQAIAMAINRQALVDTFYTNSDKLATGFMPPAILGSNPNLAAIEYNPDKAKALLTEAGFPDGFKTEFWYIPVIRGYFPDSKAIAEAIAVDLAKIGVTVELKTEDWGVYLQDRLDGKFAMWMLGWGSDNGDPDNFIGYHFAHAVGQPKKEDCYANDQLAQLLIDGNKEPDVAKREQIYQQAEQIVHDDMPRIPVAWTAGQAFFRKDAKGYQPVLFRSWYEFVYKEGK